MLVKKSGVLIIVLIITIGFSTAFASTELQRASINDPRLENAFGQHIADNINVNQQIQISADITNHQEKSQNFVYLIQIKNENNYVVSLGWISGQLSPNQKLSPSLSWTPDKEGKFIAEIFVWEGLQNHSALSEYTTLQINVS